MLLQLVDDLQEWFPSLKSVRLLVPELLIMHMDSQVYCPQFLDHAIAINTIRFHWRWEFPENDRWMFCGLT